MRKTQLEPCAALAPFVRRFTLIEAREESTRLLLPEPGVVVAFRYAGQAHLLEPGAVGALPDFVVTGVRRSARRMRTSAGGGVVIATFREAGAASFFDGALHELFGTSRALGDLVRASELDRLQARLRAAATPVERVALVEHFLLAQRRPRQPDPLVLAAVDAIRRSNGAVRVAALAAELDIGVDRLEKRFRRAVGASPKQLGFLYRLRRALDLHRSGNNLTRSALEAGYADQSHLIRDFRAVLGEAPQRFLARSDFCGTGANASDEWISLPRGDR